VSERSGPQIVSATYEAFNREGARAVLPFLSDDVVWYAAPGWAGKQEYRGHEGVLELIAEWSENFVDYKWEPGPLTELEDGRVLLLNRHQGRTRDGVPVDAALGSLWRVRDDGLIVEVRSYFTWEEALEAAGIESPGLGSPTA
jgi:ketosteroid isomerase-like protein